MPVLWVPPNAMSFLLLLITKQIEPKTGATSSADHHPRLPVGAVAPGGRWIADDAKYPVFISIFMFHGFGRTRARCLSGGH